jgi:electron transfer flavoprotein alpha subunit
MAVILAFAEVREGKVRKVSFEAVTAARILADGLGAEVAAVVIGGAGAGDQAAELAQYGADRVLVGASDALAQYAPEAYTTVLANAVKQQGDVAAVVFTASAMGKDLAPRLAAKLGTGYAGECTALAVEGGEIVATRPRFAGKAFAQVRFTERPAVISVRQNVFTPAEKPAAGAVETLDVSLDQADFGAIVREIRASAGTRLDVGEAPVVVAGGRGLREPENFQMLEDLAEALGNAAVGASRAVVDAGWRPHGEQVGQTGKTVAPTLYFAVGISGAIQHLAGMRTAKYIVAINKDPEAPIFKIADYGIVGDLVEIVPKLTEEIRKLH